MPSAAKTATLATRATRAPPSDHQPREKRSPNTSIAAATRATKLSTARRKSYEAQPRTTTKGGAGVASRASSVPVVCSVRMAQDSEVTKDDERLSIAVP